MLDYNTLNNLVEAFNKNGVSNVKLENGSTLEIKEGQLLINGEPLSIDIGVINTDNITGLSTETIEGLKAGDLVLKHTGNQIHAYKVTYKEEHQGICISYYDASYTETVSYDYVDGAWVYNSTDVLELIKYSAGNGISIEDGVITNTKPLNKKYYHNIIFTDSDNVKYTCNVIADTQLNSYSLFITYLRNAGYTSNKNMLCVSGVKASGNTIRNYVGMYYQQSNYTAIIMADVLTIDFTNGSIANSQDDFSLPAIAQTYGVKIVEL